MLVLVIPLFVGLVVNNFLTIQGEISCGEGYIPNEGNKSCIKIVYSSASWKQAELNCQSDKGNLLTIESEEENTFVTNKLTNGMYVWIGTKNQKCGDFDFINADGKKTNYQKWNRNQPDNWRGQEMCVMIFGKKAAGRYQGRWNDYGCNNRLPYVCERAPISAKKLCMEGWVEYEADGTCLKAYSEASYTTAWMICTNAGGDLVMIKDAKKNEFLKTIMKFGNFWIGLRREYYQSEFKYMDGTSMGSFRPWANPPTKSKGYDCVYYNSSNGSKSYGRWINIRCDIQLDYVCERPMSKN